MAIFKNSFQLFTIARLGRGALLLLFLCGVMVGVGTLTSCRSKRKKQKTNIKGPSWRSTAKTKGGSTPTPATSTGSKRPLTRSEGEKVVAEARKYTGTPYRYGGASRAGMDCSGLIMASYAAVGKTVPRPSSEQATCGPDVEDRNAQVGDLIFFGPSGSINHVGMVVGRSPEGALKFIHSSSTLGVTENSLTDKYWKPRFIKIVRPLVEE